MPAVSPKQRAMMAIAEHAPGKLYARNRPALQMSQGQLHDFAATKGLGPTHHDTAPPGGLAHQGSTVEGPDFGASRRAGPTFGTGNARPASQFANAGTTRSGPHIGGAAATGASAGGPSRGTEPKAFANSGSSREGYYTVNCATDSQAAPAAGGNVTRPRIRRHAGPSAQSGGSPDGFRVHTQGATTKASAAGHYDVTRGEDQNRTAQPYSAGRPGQGSATLDMGTRSSPSPAPPGREGRHAFKMAVPQFKGDKWIAGAIKHPGALTAQAKSAGQSPMGFARSHTSAPGKTGQRARLAIRLRSFHK